MSAFREGTSLRLCHVHCTGRSGHHIFKNFDLRKTQLCGAVTQLRARHWCWTFAQVAFSQHFQEDKGLEYWFAVRTSEVCLCGCASISC